MRPVSTVLLVLVACGAGYLWLGEPGAPPPTAPSPEVDRPPPPPPPSETRTRPLATTGTLRIRVSTEDGKDLPADARAGYAKYGGPPRMRSHDGDGTFLFTDAPVGEIEVIAEAKGYRETRQRVVVQPGVPAETVLVVPPLDSTSK